MENITKSFHENYTSLYSNYQALDKKNSEISEPINIELNDLNRVIKNKLVK